MFKTMICSNLGSVATNGLKEKEKRTESSKRTTGKPSEESSSTSAQMSRKSRRLERCKAMTDKTPKGQPVMRKRIEILLQKIEASTKKQSYSTKHGVLFVILLRMACFLYLNIFLMMGITSF